MITYTYKILQTPKYDQYTYIHTEAKGNHTIFIVKYCQAVDMNNQFETADWPWVLPNHGGSSMSASNMVEQHGTDVQAGSHGSHHLLDYDLEIADVGYQYGDHAQAQWGLGVQGGDCCQRLCGDHDGRCGACDGQCGACDGRDGLCGACQHGACRRGGCQNGACPHGACRRGARDQGDCGACRGGDQDGDAVAGACGACARACGGDLVHDLHVVEPQANCGVAL